MHFASLTDPRPAVTLARESTQEIAEEITQETPTEWM
jgi:hypothetical protein